MSAGQVHQRLEVAAVGGLKVAEVRVAVLLVADHEHEVVALEEDGPCERARSGRCRPRRGESARSGDAARWLRPHGSRARQVAGRSRPGQTLADITRARGRRAGSDCSAALPFALEQRRGESAPLRGDGGAHGLVFGAAAAQLSDVRARQFPLTADEGHDHVERRTLVLDQRPRLGADGRSGPERVRLSSLRKGRSPHRAAWMSRSPRRLIHAFPGSGSSDWGRTSAPGSVSQNTLSGAALPLSPIGTSLTRRCSLDYPVAIQHAHEIALLGHGNCLLGLERRHSAGLAVCVGPETTPDGDTTLRISHLPAVVTGAAPLN